MKTIHENHVKHLQDLKQQSKIAESMLQNKDWNEQEKEAISQGKAITDMMFIEGLKAFQKP